MRCRSRTYPGAALVAAAAVAAALTLTGCSSGSSEADTTPTATASATGRPAPATTGAAATSSTPPSTPTATGDDTHSVEGVWLATERGTKVQLVLGKGKAGLTSTSLCGGSYTDQDGIGLTLTCMDGNKERTSGHGVLAADGKTLTVQWAGGPTDTFTRTGLPSS
jgi:hypothetical protein